jgi:hypothetical protein
MAHYAFIDSNNIVTEVIVGRNENEVIDGITDWETHYGSFRGQVCKRTSYNNNYRKHFAGIGFTFYPNLNMPDGAFIAPQPFSSWTINPDTCQWEAPTPMPTNGKFYQWVEADLNWQEISTE